MAEAFQLPPIAGTTTRRRGKRWIWFALGLFGLTLLFRRWLPSGVEALGILAGLAGAVVLIFRAGRLLRDRVFWRVRNRILGAFIFAGLIPLALALGTVFLVAYMYTGQLAATYLRSSLSEFAQELSSVGAALEARIDAGTDEAGFASAAQLAFNHPGDHFPRFAARLLETRPDGSLHPIHVFDPAGTAPQTRVYPGGLPPGSDSGMEGIVRFDGTACLASLRPHRREPGLVLEITAPLDEHLQLRLEREKAVYAALIGLKEQGVRVDRGGGVSVRIGDDEWASDTGAEATVRASSERSRSDGRMMISWFSLLEGYDAEKARTDVTVAAIIRVPFETLYSHYLAGQSEIGRALLYAVLVLLGLFLAAELTSFVIGMAISRRITRSVHDLQQGIVALQQGDLQHRIPERHRDQLGLLAHAFNQMTASIVRLLEEVSEKKRLEQELQIAREVQATLFPKQLPKPQGLVLFGGCEPASVVSGDYYDFIVEDEASLYIVVADISGKGISAALLMANLQAAMRNQLLALRPHGPEETEHCLTRVMEQLNSQIYLNSPAEKYATLLLAHYDAETRRLCYSNAGHLPPIAVCGVTVRRLETGGMVLGLFEQASYRADTLQLDPGTVFAVYTDGVTEAANEDDEEFGDDRLLEVVQAWQARSPEAIYGEVTRRVREWRGKLAQQDDVTLIVGRVD
ncbi:MAG: SpoIIE family protein phosphatase [Acidobacteriota bacterium]